jgi:F0F1-type ATP synthase assembly protein I
LVLIDSLGRLYQKVILVQAGLALLVVLAAAIFEGKLAALSALVGGASVVVASFVYAVVARKSKVSQVSAGKVLRRHAFAEAGKWLVVLGLLFGALTSGWFIATWLVAAMCVALLGHWFVFLIVR